RLRSPIRKLDRAGCRRGNHKRKIATMVLPYCRSGRGTQSRPVSLRIDMKRAIHKMKRMVSWGTAAKFAGIDFRCARRARRALGISTFGLLSLLGAATHIAAEDR